MKEIVVFAIAVFATGIFAALKAGSDEDDRMGLG